MSMTFTIRLPRSLVERLKHKAEGLGISLEEYTLELLLNDLDPQERTQEYIEVAKDLLNQAKEELSKGDVRQAAEKVWGAAAMAVKAYAGWRDGRRLTSHGELWEYSKRMINEFGRWVSDSWAHANAMHICFYEGWCTDRHVEEAIRRVTKLVNELEKRVLT